MDRTDSRFAPSHEPASDDVASPLNLPAVERQDLLDFEPVPLRYRTDGLTPEKQRAYGAHPELGTFEPRAAADSSIGQRPTPTARRSALATTRGASQPGT